MNKKENFSGKKVIIGTLLVLFVHMGIMGTLGVFIPEIAADLNVSVGAAGMGLTFSSAVAFIGSLFVGRLLNKFSAKYVLLAGSITCAIQCVVYGSSHSLPVLYTASIVEGITTGFATITCTSTIVKEWYIKKRSSMIGYVVGGSMIGAALFIYITGILIQKVGWRYAYYVLAVFALVVGVLCNLLFIINKPADVNQKPLGWEEADKLEENIDANANGLMLNEAIKTVSFWLILILGMIFAGLSMSFVTFAPSFWQESGMDPVQSAFYVSMYSLIAVFTTMGSGKIADIFGNKAYVVYLHIGFIGAMLLAILTKTNMNSLVVWGSVILAAVAYPIYTSLAPTITTATFGSKDYENITGIFVGGSYLGLCFVSPLCGAIYEKTGSFVSAFKILAVLALISCIAILLAMKLTPLKKGGKTNEI